jgi:hypothetical protein
MPRIAASRCCGALVRFANNTAAAPVEDFVTAAHRPFLMPEIGRSLRIVLDRQTLILS